MKEYETPDPEKLLEELALERQTRYADLGKKVQDLVETEQRTIDKITDRMISIRKNLTRH